MFHYFPFNNLQLWWFKSEGVWSCFFLVLYKHIPIAKAAITALTTPKTIPVMAEFDRLPFSVPPRRSVGDAKSEPGLQSLSGLRRQCCLEAKPWFTHSDISSSFPSKQQCEHFLQLCVESFLEKKYPASQVPLQIVFDWLVQTAVTISCSAHLWQLWQAAEFSSSENSPAGQSLQSGLGGSGMRLPQGGYNPRPWWQVAQVKHFTKLPFELTTVYWPSLQIVWHCICNT